MNTKVLDELRMLHEQRGVITKSQVEYARAEIRALEKINPTIKPAEEVRHSHLRTLDSYIPVRELSLRNK